VSTEEASLVDESAHGGQTQHHDGAVTTPGPARGIAARVKQLSRRHVVAALLTVLVVASVGSVAGLFYGEFRPDQATGTAAATSVVDAARDGTVAVLSYSPASLDRDFSAAKSHLTGEFLSYYGQFTQQVVGPAVRQRSVKASAVVLQAAVSELHADSAVVLVYANQSTASKDRPEPAVTASSVSVTLTKVRGTWLISSFNPV